MRILFDSVGLLLSLAGCVAALWIIILGKARKPSAPDKCKHRHWSKWRIEKTQEVHLYGEVDEGASLPDRIDVYMVRECLRCGLPQARTDRGIDSRQYK